jgi:hypothetical protein
MVDQLRIRQCTLRLRRKGGWSWGPDPNRLLLLATQALPGLIAEKLAHLLVDQEEPLTIGRLSIRVQAKLSELAELQFEHPDAVASSILAKRVALRCKQALAAQAGIDGSLAADAPEQVQAHTPQPATFASGDDAITLLARWYEQGKLIRLLQHFSQQSLINWEELALSSLSELEISAEFEQQLRIVAEQLIRAILNAPQAPTHSRSQRLLLLAALQQRFPRQLTRAVAIGLLDQCIPTKEDESAAAVEQHAAAHPASVTAAPTLDAKKIDRKPTADKRQSVSRVVRINSPACFESNVSSVIPFVALGVLSRLGYFEVVSTALRAAGLTPDICGFVIALAYKMLSSPHRGWQRSEADRRTAAAVAGLPESVAGEEIGRMALRCSDCLSPAEGFLKQLLREGHDPAFAVLIHRLKVAEGSPWILLDSEGNFPLGWYDSQEELLGALDDFAGNTFLVSEASAAPSLFTALENRRHRFVTMVPPGRHDRWRAVDRHRTLWTNDGEAQTGWLLDQSQHLYAAVEPAERVTQAFILDRPALPVVRLSESARDERLASAQAVQFERHLALAATSALGTIAWKLWGDEPTDPLMALERLGTLDGRVTIDQDRVTVRPALGRRYQDLRQFGFLVDVSNLPWLGSRRLEFAGL